MNWNDTEIQWQTLRGFAADLDFTYQRYMEDLGLYELEHNPKNTYIVSLLKIRLIPGNIFRIKRLTQCQN
jgi:hypothetical protein